MQKLILNSLITLVLSCISFIAFSAETTIKGKIEGFDNKIIKIGFYTDYFTFEKKWLTNQLIENGSFSSSFKLEQTTQIIIRIEDKETSLFAEPGKVYNIKLAYDKLANQGQAFNKFLNLSFPFPKAEECNQQIKKFNKDYQDFFLANYERMLIKGANKETNEFIVKWKKEKDLQKNSFVANYINYTLANLEDINNVSKKELFASYLKNKSIHYNQKEYINFFVQFYRKDFESLCLKKDSRALLKALMFENDLDKSRKEIIRLKNISNPALAELYLMNGLFEVYHKKVINQEGSIKILRTISEEGMTIPNQKIASNMIQQLEKFGRSQEAVDFKLNSTNGKEVSLSDFKGKPIYLNFWANSSIPSLRELRIIQKLEETYGEKIHFVSINLDEDSTIYKNTRLKNNYDWTFLHYGNDYELREKYQVKTIPSYFLIDDNGKMLNAFAKGPTEIEKTLYELVK